MCENENKKEEEKMNAVFVNEKEAKCMQKYTLDDIRRRAERRKNRSDLRHVPNESDIRVANENAELMADNQYKTIK